jgi:purine-nucleoside phosphorylase
MSWPFDLTEPHFTPERFLEHYCEREGVTREQLRLPETLVATFQGTSYARLVGQTAATAPAWVTERPAGGSALGSRVLIGNGPRTGQPLAVTRFAVGAPATALELELAISRGVRVVLVCGAAGSLQSELPLGSTVVVTRAEREDGTSYHYLPAGEPVEADPGLVADLVEAARELGASPSLGRTWTIDALFRETAGAIERHQTAGISVVEMEAAAIFAVARVRAARAGLVVAVSDELFHPWAPGFHRPVYLTALQRSADIAVLAAERLTPSRESP